jgi:viroplasmin and RNaseH domain-containing protein
MRKITIEFTDNDKFVIIKDWNHKTWTLVEFDKNSSQRQCKEMNGTFIFQSINDFLIQMYGVERIYPEWNREKVFVNYETELIKPNSNQ